MVYTRPESIMSTTKRHPVAHPHRASAPTRDGKLTAMDFDGDFNTGAYASWGPTVANRVPVHASGPYVVPHYRALTRAVHTHLVPAGAFRGFGVPQAAIAQEQLYRRCWPTSSASTALEFRIANALQRRSADGDRPGARRRRRHSRPVSKPCARTGGARAPRPTAFNAAPTAPLRRGVGVAGMWYGCGNTSLPNPSTIRIGLKPDGRLALHQGAVDIGQGSNTVIAQIAADALGVPLDRIDLVSADTDLTPDCGKTSASRQTFVTGKAAELAGAGAARARSCASPMPATARACDLGDGTRRRRGRRREQRASISPRLPRRRQRLCALRGGNLRPADHAARRRRPGHSLCGLWLRRALAEVEVDIELGTVKVLQDHRRPRCRPRHQSDAGRRPDRRRRRPGPRHGADGGVHAGPRREPARLSDPDHRRRAADRRRS